MQSDPEQLVEPSGIRQEMMQRQYRSKTMQVQLSQIIEGIGQKGDGPLARLVNDFALPIKTKFKLARLWKHVAAEMQTYEQARMALIESKAAKDGAGKTIWIDGTAKFEGNDAAEFAAELRELQSDKIELPFEMLTLADLTPRKMDAAEILSAIDYANLDWLITEETQQREPLKAVA